MNRIVPLSLCVLSVLALTACGPSKIRREACPVASILVDTSSLTAFPDGDTNPQHATYRVDLTAAKAVCDIDVQDRMMTSRVRFDFTATRLNGSDAAQFTIPYFVAVADGDTIIDKKQYSVQFAFAPGQTSATFSDRVENIQTHIALDKYSVSYGLIAGLQLTQAQLDYNRKAGRYPQ